jgi:hypothetical protein
MGKIIFIFRVLVVSFEFLMLLLGWQIYSIFEVEIDGFVKEMKINEKFIENLMWLPIPIFVWILIEVRLLLVGDKESIRILALWPDYWMLKVHTYVQLTYSVIFLVLAIIPGFTAKGINDGIGFIFFTLGLLGLAFSGLNIYFATIRIKEIISFVKNH